MFRRLHSSIIKLIVQPSPADSSSLIPLVVGGDVKCCKYPQNAGKCLSAMLNVKSVGYSWRVFKLRISTKSATHELFISVFSGVNSCV